MLSLYKEAVIPDDQETSAPSTTSHSSDCLASIFNLHQNGYYWLDLTPSNPLIEIVLIAWSSKTGSKPHDHGRCLSCSIVLPYGTRKVITANFYEVKCGQLFLSNRQTIQPNQLHWVLPHQVHEMANLGDEVAISLHFYFPRRHRN